jgi:CxxC motif-containing protein (DUF1111 family)
MRSSRILATLLSLMVVILPWLHPRSAEGLTSTFPIGATEAPTGFDGGTNGLVDQATHDNDRRIFKLPEDAAGGLGPTFNGTSCVECHSTPIAGGSSTITELRAGHLDANNVFVPATAFVNNNQEPIRDRSLINMKATCAKAEETLRAVDNIRALRISLSLLGDGFVEAISDDTLNDIRSGQPLEVRGERVIISSSNTAADGATAKALTGFEIGRFGWKDQHVSLLSFSSDAYINEMGITNRLAPSDFTHQCEDTAANPGQIDPEDDNDIDIFTRFIRSTKAPARDATLAATAAAQRGEARFKEVGCADCHVDRIVTASTFERMNSREYVPEALANKIIHPYSDFLLHRIGTGDGIVQNGEPNTRNKVRTAPLWGLHTRLGFNAFLHDGRAATLQEAIQAHAGPSSEAVNVVNRFNGLNSAAQQDLFTFLKSL